jgi:hypothetical protein
MFFPCFVFTIAGHDLLERLVRSKVSVFSIIFVRPSKLLTVA